MSLDILEIGPSPWDESCTQLGSENYGVRARRECGAFIRQIRRQLGEEPENAELRIRPNHHDYGTYYEVAVYYDCQCEEAVEYAIMVEKNTPQFWDAIARQELGLADGDT